MAAREAGENLTGVVAPAVRWAGASTPVRHCRASRAGVELEFASESRQRFVSIDEGKTGPRGSALSLRSSVPLW
jgi:hypothetical protein